MFIPGGRLQAPLPLELVDPRRRKVHVFRGTRDAVEIPGVDRGRLRFAHILRGSYPYAYVKRRLYVCSCVCLRNARLSRLSRSLSPPTRSREVSKNGPFGCRSSGLWGGKCEVSCMGCRCRGWGVCRNGYSEHYSEAWRFHASFPRGHLTNGRSLCPRPEESGR